MTILLILLFLVLLNLIRIGARLEYSADGVLLELRIFCFSIRILPKKEKTEEELHKEALKKEKKEAKKAAKEAEEEKKRQREAEKEAGEETGTAEEEKKPENPPKRGGKLDLILSAVPAAFDALGTFLRHLEVSELKVYYGVAGDDPYDSEMTFGYVSAAMGVLTPLFDSLHIADRDFRTALDLRATEPTIYLNVLLDMAVWEYVYIVLRLGVKFLVRYLKRRKLSRVKAAERA